MNRRLLALSATLAASVLVSCDAPTRLPTHGTIMPLIVSVRDTNPNAAVTPTTARALISGPTNTSVNLVLNGAVNGQGGTWTGTASEVLPGTYTVTIEGLASGFLQYFGTSSGVSVAAGQSAAPPVTFASAVPTISAPALTNTAVFAQNIQFSAIAAATGYEVQASKDNTFSSGVISFTSAAGATTVPVTITDVGTWFLRARPTLATTSPVAWSTPAQFTVVALTGGVAPATPEAFSVAPLAPDTISGRNLTVAVREGWYSLAVRSGDTIIVETRAARLTPVSPLNTTLTLYANDGTTVVGPEVDNIATPASTDSRLVAVANATGTFKVKVGAVGATVGHYDLIVELRRLPAVPTGLTAVANSATATTLTWTDNADNELSYQIERCATAGCGGTPANFAFVDSTAANIVTFNNAGLTAGASYTYRIRARNVLSAGNTGNSAFSGTATVVLAGPAAPSGLAATTMSGTRVDLAWTDNSPNETGFEIQRCALVSCTDPDFQAVTTVGANITAYQNTGLLVDAVYTYRVRAVNAVAPSVFSAVATANTLRPAAPTFLAAVTTSATRIDIGWTENAVNETGYHIERCTGAGCSTFAVRDSVGANVATFADLTTTVENFYTYRVRAYNISGASAYSNSSSANTRTPGAPASVTATTASATLITLAWADTSSAETGFRVERCTGTGCTNFLQIGTPSANATAYNDATVTSGNTYRYQLRAAGVAGFSAYSPIVVATTLLPAPPSALTATTISGTQVNVAWTDNSDNETTFRIERCLGAACSGYAEVGSVPTGTVAYSDVGVVAGGIYRYRITAQNAVGSSAYTAIATASTEASAAPSALTATTVSTTQIDLAWTDNAGNEDGFRIERCTGPGCSTFTQIGSVGAGVTTFQNTGVGAGASYSYRVLSFNAVAASAYTNTATATTSAPTAPSGLAATTVSATRISLNWTDASSDELGFRVERCTGAGCVDFAELLGGPTTAGVTTYTDSTAAAGTVYQYRVRAFSVIGNSGYSATATGDTRAPDAPTNLVAITASGSRIDLTWTDNSTNETGFVIERCTGAGCGSFAALTTTAANATSYQDLTVALDATYTYRVRAVNNAGPSGNSNNASTGTLLPTAPSGLAAAAVSATRVDLSWTDNAVDANGFVVQRCSGAGCVTFTDRDSTSLGQLTFSDLTVTAGNSYTYRVRARNIAGRSAASAPVTATTFVPVAPTGLAAATQSNTRINLTWTDASSDELGFRIERCTGAGCSSFAVVDSVGANETTYANNGLAPSSSFTFRVTAFNASGSSAYSNGASATTNLPAIPSGLSATATTATRIDLTWTDNASDETSVAVERCATAGCTNFTLLASAAANAVSIADLTVSAGETYRYRIRALNSAGASDYSNIAQATTATPLAPSNASANATSTTTATVTWTDGSDNETGFQVERCLGAACGSFALVTTTAAGAGSFNDTGLGAGSAYSYRIRAVNLIGASGYSNTASISTVLPAAPTTLTAQTISASRIDLAWLDNATNETSYEIERCQGAACADFGAIDSVAANTTAYQNSGLPANIVFRYRVRALNGAGASAYSNIVSAATDVPADPSALTALATSATSIRIDWTDNANNETDFVIQRCTVSGCTDADFNDLQLVGANVTSYLDGTVSAAATATYRVKAINLNGESRYSNQASAATLAPSTPTAFTATTITGTRIDLTWVDGASNETGYEIERCSGNGCVAFARLDSLSPGATAFSDVSATVNGEYTYRVRAVNLVGPSGYTGGAFANTYLPAASTGLTATTISADQVDLAWNDVANNEDGFRIERCAGPTCADFTTLVTLGEDMEAYTDGSVVLGTTYSYRIFAFNAAGDAAAAGPATVTTLLPAAPSTLLATVTAPTTIRLAWTDASGNEDGFRIERCTGAGCSSYVEIAVVGAGVALYDNSGLSGNTFYRYRTRAFNAAGVSAYSGIVTPNTFLPTTPTALSATMVLGNRVDIAWSDNATNESGYRIERCAGAACADFAEITTVAANATAHADSTLAFGAEYRYRIRAYNGVGNSVYSNTANGNTNVPVDPSALAAAAQSTTRIDLTWTDNAANETGFTVERCAGPGCSTFAPVATLGANISAYSDTPITAATSFTYRVRAFNLGASGYTNAATATTILPSDPTGATATAVSGVRVDLGWTDNANNEYGYRVERCSGAACSGFAQVATVGPNVSEYSDLALTNGLLYRYRVRAYNGAGTSAYTGEVQATTNVPGIPTSFTATTMTASVIRLDWTDNATDELGFVIERCVGAGCSNYTVLDTLVVPNAIQYFNSGLTASTAYRYRIRAYNASGVSGLSNTASASTNTPADPAALAALTVSATRIDLTWTDNADNELAFDIERCSGAACVNFTTLTSVAPNTTAYSDLTALLNTSYRYRVRGTNNAGVSGYSAIADANTLVPANPTTLAATTLSATQIDLSWADNAGNETAYRVERCVGPGCTLFTQIASLAAGTTSYSDEGLTPNASYSYRVRATNVPGASGYTAVATATTAIPSDPSALSATTITATRIDLAWTDNSSNELRFVVQRCNTAACDDVVTPLDSVTTNVTAYSDLTVSLGNRYYYRVVARNAAGTSGGTVPAVGSTLLPAAPVTLAAAIATATRVDLSWTDVSDNEQRFVIERCTGPGCGTFVPVDSTVAGVTVFSDATAVTGAFYSYRVRASNAAGTSGFTNTAGTALLVPAAPTLLGATTQSESQVALNWTDNSFNERSFLIERCTGPACATFAVIDSVGTNVTGYLAANLVIGNSYTFRVRANNPVGPSAFTNAATSTTLLATVVNDLTAVVIAPTRITLDWTDNANNEAGYRIERCTGAGCSSFVEIAVLPADSSAFVNTGLTLNQVYNYRVRPFNAVGPSPYSNQATENTLLPLAPTSVTATAQTVNLVNLSWADNADNESSYIVEVCQAGVDCATYTLIATLGAGVTTFPHATAPSVNYAYRVRAFRTNVGPSATVESNIASTFLTSPTYLKPQTLLRNRTDITWNDNSTIETGYRLLYCVTAVGTGCEPSTIASNYPANTTVASFPTISANLNFNWAVQAVSNTTVAARSVIAGNYTPVLMDNGFNYTGITDTLNAERHYVLGVPAASPEVRFVMSGGSGEADLHVRFGGAATTSLYNCRPYPFGNNETCAAPGTAPSGWPLTAGGGDYFAMPHAYGAITGVALKGSFATRFGFPTQFAGTGQWNSGFIFAQQISISQTGTLTHLGLIASSPLGSIMISLYSNRAGGTSGSEPGNLLAQTSGVMAGGLQEYATPNITVAAGTYWVVFQTSNFGGNTYYLNSGGASTTWKYYSASYGTGFPASFPTAQSLGGLTYNFVRENMNFFARVIP